MNAKQIPYNISDLSLVFFAKQRPWTVPASHMAFAEIKAALQGDPELLDIEHIVALADPREPIVASSKGVLRFEGNDMLYGDRKLHNTWVEKILKFREEGELFDPVFLALEDLQANPDQAARDRLPIFVERSKLGFLPDGRIAGFKGVKADYHDVHSGTVLYQPGTTVSIPREQCDTNHYNTCSRGLHIGAIDYITEMGYGWGSDRRMLLCAFWPRHVAAVPTDYRGGKIRVEQLDVLEEVDRDYVDRLLNNGQTIVRGFTEPERVTAPEPETGVEEEGEENLIDTEESDDEADPLADLKVGDVIAYTYLGDTFYARVNDPNFDPGEVSVTDHDDDDVVVDSDNLVRVVPAAEVTGAMVAVVGMGVWIEGHAVLRDGLYEVSERNTDGGTANQSNPEDLFFRVYVDEGRETEIAVRNKHIVKVFEDVDVASEAIFPLSAAALVPATQVTDHGDGTITLVSTDGHDLRGEAEDLVARAEPGDKVEISAGGWPPGGIYQVGEDHGDGYTVETLYDGNVRVSDAQVVRIIKG